MIGLAGPAGSPGPRGPGGPRGLAGPAGPTGPWKTVELPRPPATTHSAVSEPPSVAGPTWVTMDNVHFEFKRSRLLPRCAEKIAKIAAWANTEHASLTLDSHLQDPEANDFVPGLGVRRAQAVLDALVEAGVSPGRIFVRAYGERRPLCWEPTEGCRALNRRVEILAALR